MPPDEQAGCALASESRPGRHVWRHSRQRDAAPASDLPSSPLPPGFTFVFGLCARHAQRFGVAFDRWRLMFKAEVMAIGIGRSKPYHELSVWREDEMLRTLVVLCTRSWRPEPALCS